MSTISAPSPLSLEETSLLRVSTVETTVRAAGDQPVAYKVEKVDAVAGRYTLVAKRDSEKGRVDWLTFDLEHIKDRPTTYDPLVSLFSGTFTRELASEEVPSLTGTLRQDCTVRDGFNPGDYNVYLAGDREPSYRLVTAL